MALLGTIDPAAVGVSSCLLMPEARKFLAFDDSVVGCVDAQWDDPDANGCWFGVLFLYEVADATFAVGTISLVSVGLPAIRLRGGGKALEAETIVYLTLLSLLDAHELGSYIEGGVVLPVADPMVPLVVDSPNGVGWFNAPGFDP
ncbi:hypothetical protein Nepgr_016369 [Nepenthes gracilis]|uniref:Uncharacterized protein n=1 Tax=Nepenthes gracilis TaxID=150966 RepID=A0AAD3SNE6_NEPGR|nr:hypothetical protein Nepgr_016369 [Nepenthes gracilis]